MAEMANDESGSLFRDLAVETAESWRTMAPLGRAILGAGVIGVVVLNVLERTAIPSTLLSVLRVLAIVAVVIGCVANARAADEFYQRIYLYACTYTLVASMLILYALAEFGVNLGVRSISLVAGIFAVSFVVAFAVLRRG